MPENNIGGPEPPKSSFEQISEDIGYTVEGAMDLFEDACTLVDDAVRKGVGSLYHEVEGSLFGDLASCLGIEYYLGRPEVAGKSITEASLPVVEITDHGKEPVTNEKPSEKPSEKLGESAKAAWTIPDIVETPSEQRGAKTGQGFSLTPEQKYRAAAAEAFEAELTEHLVLVADPKFEAVRGELDLAVVAERKFLESKNHIGENSINRTLEESKIHEMQRTRVVSEAVFSPESFMAGVAVTWAASAWLNSKAQHSIKSSPTQKPTNIGGAEK